MAGERLLEGRCHEAILCVHTWLTQTQFTYYYVVAYISVLWLAKASLLCSYHVVASRLSGPIALAVQVAIWTTAISYPICMFSYLFWCRPMTRYWYVSCISFVIQEP